MAGEVTKKIIDLLRRAGVTGHIELTSPPSPEMGDFTFACFALANERKLSPQDVARDIGQTIILLDEKVMKKEFALIREMKVFGPYINFFLEGTRVSKIVLKTIDKAGEYYGVHTLGKRKRVLVEFGCPNPLKAFHLGHLRNLITGESVARILENAGYDIKRVNYQGDVGMHVAKTLWGIRELSSEYMEASKKTIPERVAFLGRAYAYGSTKYEEDEKVKKEIETYNAKVYEMTTDIVEVYRTTRGWSLEYFDTIYNKLGARYDHLYFESEVFARGKELVKKWVKKGVFKESEGAIIFPGSEYGLHDRVFINSKGYPTYEGKELALAERHFADYKPARVVHVVGKEQTEYFKVLFQAIETLWPKTKGKEHHLIGGYLQLKGEKKMSSRTGNVITGDALIEAVESRVGELMKEKTVVDKGEVRLAITVAALKYAMLKTGVSDDIAFDMEESISTSGDSGPYLLYIVARIKSILRKIGTTNAELLPLPGRPIKGIPKSIESVEKQLLLQLAEFPEATRAAAETLDPSAIAHYLLTLAQAFNRFYEECPVLQAEPAIAVFRVHLMSAVDKVMVKGLALLGINTVGEM